MSSPNQHEVRVATDALRTEASAWHEQSVQMQQICTKVNSMALGRIEAGIFFPVVGPYDEVVQQVVMRSGEGVRAMTDIAATLRQVATTYDNEDAASEHRLRGLH